MADTRDDGSAIHDTAAARLLAELIIDMQLVTNKGLVARKLARRVLGIQDCGRSHAAIPITTNGTTRLIPEEEPVFLIRGQDVLGAAAVRAWADLAEAKGADPRIVRVARAQADEMDAWPKKKVPDLPKAA